MRFWNFTPTAEGTADEVDLTVHGYISDAARWDDEVGAKQFREDLDKHKAAKRFNVRINSGGGSAFGGIAIHSMLKAHPAEKIVTVEGLAASAASLIAMAGTKVRMATGAMLMVHNPSSIAWGESAELRKTADVLDKLRDSLVAIYRAKTGKTAEELKGLLDAETWMTAQEAVEAGFADEVLDESVVAEARSGQVFLNAVGYPADLAPLALRRRLGLAAPAAAPPAPPPPAAVAAPPTPRALTRELLAAEAPQLLTALLAEGHAAGVAAERARLQAIDEVALPGHAALVAKARYAEPMTAEALAFAIVRAEASSRRHYLAGVREDATEAAVPSVPLPNPVPAAGGGKPVTAQDKAEEDEAVAAIVGKP